MTPQRARKRSLRAFHARSLDAQLLENRADAWGGEAN